MNPFDASQIDTTPLTREEFLLATKITDPEEMSVWMVRVASILLSLATSSTDEVDVATTHYIIQQLALKMPDELLMAGTMAMISAANEMTSEG